MCTDPFTGVLLIQRVPHLNCVQPNSLEPMSHYTAEVQSGAPEGKVLAPVDKVLAPVGKVLAPVGKVLAPVGISYHRSLVFTQKFLPNCAIILFTSRNLQQCRVMILFYSPCHLRSTSTQNPQWGPTASCSRLPLGVLQSATG